MYNQLDGAKSTLQYWEDNLDEWCYTLTGIDIGEEKGFNWKQLGKADVGGAIGGVGGWGVAALFRGPVGWGVAGAAALGGAVTGSLADVIDQVWVTDIFVRPEAIDTTQLRYLSEEEAFNYLYELSTDEKIDLLNQINLNPEDMERFMSLLQLRTHVYDSFISLILEHQ